jgi:dihydroorotate dehydrogenase
VYKLIRPLLFGLGAERSHNIILWLLSALSHSGPALRLIERTGAGSVPSIPCEIAGLNLPNPVGLAAGLDKDAKAFPALAAMGFGWVELGTVTPRPQPGNSGKRLFRVETDAALVNRMGFNNAGLRTFTDNIQRLRRHSNSVTGINIGKNADTPIPRAVDDYITALDAVYTLADYVAVNISSPNTASLRDLQNSNYLDDLLAQLVSRRDELAGRHNKSVPLFLKIAPDLKNGEIAMLAKTVREHRLDAVIATNTTISRPDGPHPAYAEKGGLSGRPLKQSSTATIGQLFSHLQGEIPIIGVGGIEDARDVVEKLRAGARIVQIYTSLIYQGPAVIRGILLGLEQQMQSMHISSWNTFLDRVRT